MSRTRPAPQAHILTACLIHLGLAGFSTIALGLLSPHPPMGLGNLVVAFMFVYVSLAPLVLGVCALVHQAGWLRWTSGDRTGSTRRVEAEPAAPSQGL